MYMKWIWTVTDGRRVHFVRLVYTVFYVQRDCALSGLQVRWGIHYSGVFIVHYSDGSSITWVNVHYNDIVRHSGVSV